MRKALLVSMFALASISCAEDRASEQADPPPTSEQVIDASRGRLDAAVRDEVRDAGATAAMAERVDAGGRSDAGAVTGACSSADLDATPAELHAAAAEVLTAQTPCGFSACHAGSRAKAGLRLSGISNLRALLVDKPACEAPALSLVAGMGGGEALEKSWLWLKVTHPADASGALIAAPGWGPSASCGQGPAEPYGMLMPLGAGGLDEVDLAPVRNWICAGAPGP